MTIYFGSSTDAIEALQARVADQSAQLTRHTNLIDQLQEERCKLAAELAEIHKQEPVSHRYRFIHPISGEPVWRDSSPMWNGQCVQEVQPLFAAPVPPVREPLSDNTIAALRQAIAQPAQVPAGSIRLWDAQWVSIVNHDNAYNGWSTNDAVNHAVRMTERYIAANVAQNNLPPLPAVKP